ncbi:hypothetical protein BG003_011444 [Podila horticola]|nr:hypothetical protein BG003_011444 [Podila horticola]
MPHDFYHSRVDEADSPPYTMSDFHYTKWMVYHSPPLSDFDAAKNMSAAAKTLDRERATLQGKLAHITGPLDIYAHETVKRKGQQHEEGKRGLKMAANIRLMLGDLVAQISATRKRHILEALNIHIPAEPETNPIITTEEQLKQDDTSKQPIQLPHQSSENAKVAGKEEKNTGRNSNSSSHRNSSNYNSNPNISPTMSVMATTPQFNKDSGSKYHSKS